MAEALERALSMPLAEQARHENLARLRANDLSVWRDTFVADLRSVAAAVTRRARPAHA